MILDAPEVVPHVGGLVQVLVRPPVNMDARVHVMVALVPVGVLVSVHVKDVRVALAVQDDALGLVITHARVAVQGAAQAAVGAVEQVASTLVREPAKLAVIQVVKLDVKILVLVHALVAVLAVPDALEPVLGVALVVLDVQELVKDHALGDVPVVVELVLIVALEPALLPV